MSGIDAAWWHMSRPHNPLVIVGVLQLESAPSLARLRERIAARLLAEPRFRQRPVCDGDADFWELDPRFRIERHVVRLRADAADHGTAHQQLIARLCSQPLDPAHPLWKLALVPGQAGARVVLRMHHCYADGTALVRLLLAISDASADSGAEVRMTDRPKSPAPAGVLDELLQLLSGTERALAPPPAAGAGAAAGDSNDAAASAGRFARAALTLGREVLRLLEMPDESPTPFKGAGGQTKAVAWSSALPLAEVKAVARAFGCSIQALMLSCTAAALAARLREQGLDPRGIEFRVLLPTPLRRTRRPESMAGNHFGLVNLALPLGISNPVARAWEVHRRVEALASSHQAMLLHLLLGVVGLLAEPWRQRAIELLSNKASAVVTTVPGPPGPRFLAGARITEMMFWVPQAGDIGLGISLLSYDGRLRVGVMSDAARLPDPQVVADGLVREFARLQPLAHVMASQAQ